MLTISKMMKKVKSGFNMVSIKCVVALTLTFNLQLTSSQTTNQFNYDESTPKEDSTYVEAI